MYEFTAIEIMAAYNMLKDHDGDLDLSDYKYPLPEELEAYEGNLYLSGYRHQLPPGLRA